MKEEKSNPLLEWSIRSFIALSITAIGLFRHIYGTEDATGSLLESGWANSSQLALLEVHLMTMLELTFLVLTIFSRFNKAMLLGYGILGVIYLASLLSSLSNESYLFADLTRLNGWLGIPLVFAVVLFSFTASKRFGGFEKRGPVWLIIALPIVLIGGYSSYYWSAESEFTDLGNPYKVKYSNWDWYWEKVDDQLPEIREQEEYTLCFFSTTCSHCNEAAKRIGVYQKRFSNRQMYAVFFSRAADKEFWSSDSIVQGFLVQNHLKLEYIKMLDYEAVSIADNHFPVIVTMKDGQPVKKYVGEELNAWAFDHLFK
ncbi:MAG: hypothetical protein H6599_10135 [Flavobacteriales bacterium]|nr:hypothetical protein [Flavobacteriales bacterium]